MKVDLASFKNKEFNPGSFLKRTLWYYVNLIFFNNGWFPFYGLKIFWLKLFGATIGVNVLIKPYVNIKYPWLLSIGDNVWIGEQVWIDNLAKVIIGNNVCISQGALLLCGNHNYKLPTFDLIIKEIVLEDGVWVCAKAIITQGVVCKSHSVIGVGAIITLDTEPFTVYSSNITAKAGLRNVGH